MVESSMSPDEFKAFVRSTGATHILMRTALVDNYLRDNCSREEISRFMSLVTTYWKRLYESNGHAVWDLQA